MKILVFIKQVPDTDDVKLDPKTGNLQREGVRSILNPNDAHSIECAMQLKRKYGATVAAVSMGPPQAEAVLKKALALGCDEAYLLSDRAFGGADTLATAYTLAKAAEKVGDYDLLLFGKNASDGDTAQTGPATAAYLNIPQITLATSLDIKDGWVVCDRVLDNTAEKVRAKLPALVTVCDSINAPEYPTPKNIMKALKKPCYVWNAADISADTQMTGVHGSPSSTKKVFEPPKRNSDVCFFDGTASEIAAKFVDMLENEHIL